MDRDPVIGAVVRASHGDDDFSVGVPFSEIPERLSHLTQRVTSTDDRPYFSSFKKLFHDNQVLCV